jgi:hypothetical protein
MPDPSQHKVTKLFQFRRKTNSHSVEVVSLVFQIFKHFHGLRLLSPSVSVTTVGTVTTPMYSCSTVYTAILLQGCEVAVLYGLVSGQAVLETKCLLLNLT